MNVPEIEKDDFKNPALEGITFKIINPPTLKEHKCRIPRLAQGEWTGAIVQCLDCNFQWFCKEHHEDGIVMGWSWIPALDDIDQELNSSL